MRSRERGRGRGRRVGVGVGVGIGVGCLERVGGQDRARPAMSAASSTGSWALYVDMVQGRGGYLDMV